MNRNKRDKSRKSNKNTKQTRASSKKSNSKAKESNAVKTGKSEPEAVATIEQPKQEVKRPEKFDPVVAVMNKYTDAGWQVVRMPKNSISDILAQKNKKLHFIQVVPEDKIDDNKYHGLSKNSFIQNAFSNSAAPIYAYVNVRQRKGADGMMMQCVKIVLEDINSLNRVIVGGNRKKQMSANANTSETN